jgi:flagellar biosynthesis/type III secretory pathway chaperone
MKQSPSSSTRSSNQLGRTASALDDQAAFAQLVAAISRLETVVDTETELLSTGQDVDLRDITARKSRGLYDLNKALRQLGERVDAERLEAPMRGLREKLDRNQTVLSNHLRAVGELAELMRRAVEMDEADGTYSIGRGAGTAS